MYDFENTKVRLHIDYNDDYFEDICEELVKMNARNLGWFETSYDSK
jgi:hypothetical protein